jgi:hypothetical protein
MTTLGYGTDEGRWRVGGAFRYRSGTPVEIEDDDLDELLDRPGSDTVDIESGRVRPQIVTDVQAQWRLATRPGFSADLVLWMDNVFDARYAFNFGNPFSGTHFGAPRRAGLTVRLRQ